MTPPTPMNTISTRPPEAADADMLVWLADQYSLMSRHYDACLNCNSESRGLKFCSRECEEEYR